MVNPFELIETRLQNIERYLEILSQVTPNAILSPIVDEVKFTQDELAKYLGVSRVTIYRYQKNNVFRSYKAGRTVFFKKHEVDSAMCSDQPKKVRK